MGNQFLTNEEYEVIKKLRLNKKKKKRKGKKRKRNNLVFHNQLECPKQGQIGKCVKTNLILLIEKGF